MGVALKEHKNRAWKINKSVKTSAKQIRNYGSQYGLAIWEVSIEVEAGKFVACNMIHPAEPAPTAILEYYQWNGNNFKPLPTAMNQPRAS
ncbi:hypothetical protein Cflav_PD0932 [Pedosphaera parvula Ellin514]|uniref:Uncharacterized protein n=1 Tax=Pedosphaera parvula (strain Ellin514) TaxID=320771 RepID=B9XQL8_PEDPL|nr:hypothetical protein Cflav_PD0932 [Pedosphaera parvula Ellin514]